MEKSEQHERDLNFAGTELRLGLPGIDDLKKQVQPSANKSNKRSLPDMNENCTSELTGNTSTPQKKGHPAPKAQVVGWPPIRSFRKNCLAKKNEAENSGVYVKVSMDGAPYLRKIDLNIYKGYKELVKALEDMFKFSVGGFSEREGYNGSEYVPTYEDKDGDWMLVGDVPWDMFISSCKKLRIMKGSEARGMGCVV
ncbi:AUX/IAA domain [Dillenia turbinata]|uniref:Auxin-responsive protein n=1 Tax=Dillenia turbinata TaxID=194707 RepID=A0AAN8YWF5_9MAGN